MWRFVLFSLFSFSACAGFSVYLAASTTISKVRSRENREVVCVGSFTVMAQYLFETVVEFHMLSFLVLVGASHFWFLLVRAAAICLRKE